MSYLEGWPAPQTKLKKKAIVDLPVRLKACKSKRTSGNSLSPLGAQSKNLGAAASQTLLDVASRGKITSATQATSGVA